MTRLKVRKPDPSRKVNRQRDALSPVRINGWTGRFDLARSGLDPPQGVVVGAQEDLAGLNMLRMQRLVVRPRIQVPLLVAIFAGWTLLGLTYFTPGALDGTR